MRKGNENQFDKKGVWVKRFFLQKSTNSKSKKGFRVKEGEKGKKERVKTMMNRKRQTESVEVRLGMRVKQKCFLAKE